MQKLIAKLLLEATRITINLILDKVILKRISLLLTAILVASLGLAACGGVGTGGTIKIVSDLPMTGSALQQTQTIVNAIEQAVAEKEYKTCNGKWTIQYEAHDDASPELQNWDETVVKSNAELYVNDPNIVAVIGTYNSDAAKFMIPILNPANIVMISPANTYPGLTKPGKGAEGEPDKYYPSGERNYARVVPADDLQGLVAAQWARDLKAKSVYILDNGELYGSGIADVFEKTATNLGLTIVHREGVDTKAANYTALAAKITALNPDLVYYGGTTQSGGGLLVRDIRAAEYKGLIMGSDGLYEQAFIDIAGKAAKDVYVTFGGIPPSELTGKADQWRNEYKARYGADPEPYALYGYVAAQVLLDAFERVCAAGGLPSDRKAVRDAVFATKDFNSIVGKFSIDANGDTTLTAMSGSQVKNGKFEFVTLLGGG